MMSNKSRKYASLSLALTGVWVLVLLFVRRFFRQAGEVASQGSPSHSTLHLAGTGLTEAEAAARLDPEQNNIIQSLAQRTRQQMIRESTLTIFNLNLIALAVVQTLFGRPLDALITIGILLLSVGINVFQEEFARYRVQSLQELIRTEVTAIRDGKPRRIEADQIVVGDELSAGPGDQIMVDGEVSQGEVVIDESLLSGDSAALHKHPGERLFAGSICISGRAIYRVEKVGDQRLIVKHLRETSGSRETLTPIEQVINRVMRLMLLLIAVLAAGLLARYYSRHAVSVVEYYLDAANVILNLVPAGLFFMVILTYVAATADLAQRGALVRQARSVESLAGIDVLCLAKAGFLTGTAVEIRPLPVAEGVSQPEKVVLGSMLGDFARNSSDTNAVIQAMASTFGGTRRAVQEEANLWSVYGWDALVFDDEDLRGVYVLGDPQVLQSSQLLEEQEETGETPRSPSSIGKRAASLARPYGRLFRRGSDRSPTDQEAINAAMPVLEPTTTEEIAVEILEVEEAPSGGILGRLRQSTMKLLSRTQVEQKWSKPDHEPSADESILTFAYLPEVISLRDENGLPQLPQGLITLCDLSYQDKIRPEAIDAIGTFTARKVEIKIFTPDSPDKTLRLLAQANTDEQSELSQISVISGPELAELEPEQLSQAAEERAVFGQVSSQQTEKIVQELRASGRAVGFIGDGVSDVAAMRQADLAISRRDSSPATLSVADIILLDDSPLVLPRIVDKGQRIVNGLMDVLKLYLTQIFYMLILIVGVSLVSYGFPISSAQAGLVLFLTVTIPAVGLSIWAVGGQLPEASLGRQLARFTWPASLTMGLVALAIYVLFLQRLHSLEYAQLAVTHTLVFMGLFLAIFIKPPLQFSWGRLPVITDLRPTLLVLAAAVLFAVMTYIPLAQRFLEIAPLQQPDHYLVIGLIVGVWALGMRLLLFVVPSDPWVRRR